jgi:hypothetical protein
MAGYMADVLSRVVLLELHMALLSECMVLSWEAS